MPQDSLTHTQLGIPDSTPLESALIPGAEAAVETARRHGRRGPVERARGAGRISLRLAMGFVFRRGSFGRSGSLGLSRLLEPRPWFASPALSDLRSRGALPL